VGSKGAALACETVSRTVWRKNDEILPDWSLAIRHGRECRSVEYDALQDGS